MLGSDVQSQSKDFGLWTFGLWLSDYCKNKKDFGLWTLDSMKNRKRTVDFGLLDFGLWTSPKSKKVHLENKKIASFSYENSEKHLFHTKIRIQKIKAVPQLPSSIGIITDSSRQTELILGFWVIISFISFIRWTEYCHRCLFDVLGVYGRFAKIWQNSRTYQLIRNTFRPTRTLGTRAKAEN